MESLNNREKRSLRLNLARLMSECKVTMAELHRQTKVPLTTIKRICNDDFANPTLSSLLPIADFFSVTINQLAGVDPLPNDRIIGAYFEKRESWIHLPVLTWEQVVHWQNVYIDSQSHRFISTDAQVSPKSFALVVEEDDWLGFFRGSSLIVDPELKPAHRDYVVTYKEGQNRASFNQLLIDEGIAYLKPLNQSYKTKTMDQSYKLLGVLVQARMDAKELC